MARKLKKCAKLWRRHQYNNDRLAVRKIRSHYPKSLRIGIHTSTAGSLEKAAIKAHELDANTFQIFSASPRMWRARTPDFEEIKLLNDYRAKHDLIPLVIHGSYLINLGAPPSVIREKSIAAFSGELERALLIGAE